MKSPPAAESGANSLADALACLDDGARRVELDGGGRIRLDRAMPFAVLYRVPPGAADAGTEELLAAEPLSIVASAAARHHRELRGVVDRLVADMSRRFGAFLLLEISTGDFHVEESAAHSEINFRLKLSPTRMPLRFSGRFKSEMEAARIHRRDVCVEIVKTEATHAAGLKPLLAAPRAQALNCFVLGLEIQPVFRGKDGALYPLLHRQIRRRLSNVLKKAFFEFSHRASTFRPEDHHALGRRTPGRVVWKVDADLAAVEDKFDFLLQVTPVNARQAYAAFVRSKCSAPPELYYRPLPADPDLLRRSLFNIRLENVEDPTMEFLLRQKRNELDTMLWMLGERGTSQFRYGSLKIFGPVKNDLLDVARDLLERIPPGTREGRRIRWFGCEAFAESARAEVEYYRRIMPSIDARVEVRSDVVGLLVSRGRLLIGRDTRVPSNRVEALLQHEIGTHMLTWYNGAAQPFRQLRQGLAGYEELQEGLAVLSEFLVGGLSPARLRLLAARVVAVDAMIRGADFVETFRLLNVDYGFARETAFTVVLRVFRSGGLTKDAVYLRGLHGLLKYLGDGGEIESLFIGKIAAKHLALTTELLSRGILRPAPLEPRYLRNPQTAKRLEMLARGMNVADLITRRNE